MAKVSPFKFLQEVRAEAQKVTWPTRKETTITTIMVFVMAAAAAVFFPDRGPADPVRRDHDPRYRKLTSGPNAEIPEMAKRWYIVHAYSNFENKVENSIRDHAKQRGLTDLFDEVLVPKEKVVEVRRGRKVDTERKFFPGYVLVKVDLTDEAFHLIKNTPKVTGFLGADNKPMPIPEARPNVSRGRWPRVSNAQSPRSVRGRRAGPRLRRAVRIVQRRGRGSRRGALPPQGRGVDLRPRHAGRTGIHAGRQDLTALTFKCDFACGLDPAA